MEAFILTYGIVTVEIFRTTEYFNKIQNKLQTPKINNIFIFINGR